MPVKIAVVYYSSTGNVYRLAQAVTEGAEKAGAEVRLRRVEEIAPDTAVDANPIWRAHLESTADIAVATHDDLAWADAYAFGTPTRYGNIAAQLKQFLDSTGPLWMQRKIVGKPATAFTSAINVHGGNESTLLALYNVMYHWGSIIVPPGYLDSSVSEAFGNPYGTAHPSGAGQPAEPTLAAARFQGSHLATVTAGLLNVSRTS